MIRLATAVLFLPLVLSGCVRLSADEIARNAEAQDKVKRAAENAEWQRTVEPAIKQRQAEVAAGSRRLSPAALAERVANTTANPATQAAYKVWSTCVGQAAGRLNQWLHRHRQPERRIHAELKPEELTRRHADNRGGHVVDDQ